MGETSNTKYLWLLLGWASVGLAAVGAVLPLLPTTPLLLVAAFAFSRSSDRWHRWLTNHPRFGPLILDWRLYGAIATRAKVAATLSLIVAMGISVALVTVPWILIVQATLLLAVAVFIWSRPIPPVDSGLG